MHLQSTSEIPGDVARAYEVARVLIKYGLAELAQGDGMGARQTDAHKPHRRDSDRSAFPRPDAAWP